MKTLVDLTPVKHRCEPVGHGCPAVFKSDQGTYVIVGKITNADQYHVLRNRIGEGEAAVEISVDLVNACCGVATATAS